MFEEFCQAQGVTPQSLLGGFDLESKAQDTVVLSIPATDKEIVQKMLHDLLQSIPETDEHGVLDILQDPSAMPSNIQFETEGQAIRARGITLNNIIKYSVLHAANRPITDFAGGNAQTWSELCDIFMTTMSSFSSIEAVMNRILLLVTRSLLIDLSKPIIAVKPKSATNKLSINLSQCAGVLEFLSLFLSTNVLLDFHTIDECFTVQQTIDRLSFLSTIALTSDDKCLLPPYQDFVQSSLSFPFRKTYAKAKRDVTDLMAGHMNNLALRSVGISRVHQYRSLYDLSSSSSSSSSGISLNNCGIFVENTVGIWDGKDDVPSSEPVAVKQETIEVFGMSQEMAEELLGENGSRPPISRVLNGYDMTSSPTMSVFDIDTIELARQLTIIDHCYYQSIPLFQLRHKCWGSARMLHKAEGARAFIDRFVSLCQWTTHAVLACQSLATAFGSCGYAGTPPALFGDESTMHYSLFVQAVRRIQSRASDCTSKRVLMMTKLIDLASELDKLNNFHGVMAVISGLKHTAIRSYLNNVPQASQVRFAALNEMMSESKSYANYREQLNSRIPTLTSPEAKRSGSTAVIPHLAVHLADLTFIEDGNPDYLIDLPHLINVFKLRGLNSSYRLLWQFQNKKTLVYNLDQVRFISILIQRDLKPFQRLKTQNDTDAVSKLLATLASEMKDHK